MPVAAIVLCALLGAHQAAPPSSSTERVVPYAPSPWQPDLWPSSPPEDCPFDRSAEIRGVAFTHRWAAYTDADTWYPSWASDGNLYSGWTDGEIGDESVHSSGRGRARSFPAKQIRWMAFLVDAVSDATQDVGLAEIAVFRAR